MDALTTTPEQRAALLGKADWARELSPGDLAHLASAGTICTCARGERIVTQGAEERWMAVILEGEIEVTANRVAGEDALLRVMGPGRAIGEFSLLDAEPRSASVDALEPTTLIRWNPDDIDALLDTEPRVAFRLVVRLARDLSRRIRAKDAVPTF